MISSALTWLPAAVEEEDNHDEAAQTQGERHPDDFGCPHPECSERGRGDRGAEPTPATLPVTKALYSVAAGRSTLSPIRASMWLADTCCSLSHGTSLGVQSCGDGGNGQMPASHAAVCCSLSYRNICAFLKGRLGQVCSVKPRPPVCLWKAGGGRRRCSHSLTPFSPNTSFVPTNKPERTPLTQTVPLGPFQVKLYTKCIYIYI